MIMRRVLTHSLYYNQNPGELISGLRVPGELRVFAFSSPVMLLASAFNAGAREVAMEVWAESTKRQTVSGLPLMTVADAETALASTAPTPMGKTIFMLYLNKATFTGPGGGAVATLVQRALDRKIPVVMLHEQLVDRGIYIYVYVCICIYIYIYYVCVYTYMHTCKYIYIYIGSTLRIYICV